MAAAEKKAPSIALLFGGKSDKDEYPGGKSDKGAMMGKGSMMSDASLERCRVLASKAFPDEDWSDDERVKALKELIAYELEA